jgi:toxin ParE1/3/4
MPFSTSSAFAPAARRQAHQDTNIPQIVVRFGRHGYIVRYRILPPDNTIFVTRIWHGREARE